MHPVVISSGSDVIGVPGTLFLCVEKYFRHSTGTRIQMLRLDKNNEKRQSIVSARFTYTCAQGKLVVED